MKKSGFALVLLLFSIFSIVSAGKVFAESATAIIRQTAEGSAVLGAVRLEETEDGLKITAQFFNCPPGKHGFHIHENGSCGEEGKAAGGHYNPEGTPHGLVLKDGFSKAHAGDFGNVEIGSDGAGETQMTIPGLHLTGTEHNVAGKAFILHEKEDDLGQPTGNAGGRIGCGMIKVIRTGN